MRTASPAQPRTAQSSAQPRFSRRPARQRASRRIACALVVLAAALWACAPALAWADDRSGAEADDGNSVNTQQLPDSSFIYDTSIIDLGTADTYYDNQTVQVVGEVVGDSIRASLGGGHRWITLAAPGGAATLSVYMSSESAAKIDTFGEYGSTGTSLQVRGTFHLVCPDHDGLSDLHAEVVSVVEPGSHHEDEFDLNRFVPGIATVAVGLAMMAAFYWIRERRR